MMNEMRAVHDGLLDLRDVLEAQLDEALAMEKQGYRVPVAWVGTALVVIGNLLEPCSPEKSQKGYWEWRLQSILEHLRYYQDMDLSWSVIWDGKHSVWQGLWRHSQDLLLRIEGMTEADILEEIERNQREDPR